MASRLMDDALAAVAVVVPVGPEDTPARELCDRLATLPPGAALRIVCVSRAEAARVRDALALGPRWEVVAAPRGRAWQQNAGAEGVAHRWLWFVHADSRLASATLPALAAFVRRDEPALGYFDLRFHDGPALMRLNTVGAWIRSRWLALPFGDQGFVLPRATFAALGGFDTRLDYGEDHELVWRMRRAGIPLRPLGAPLYTSARRYADRGWLRTTRETLRETWRQARRFGRNESRA
jgi:hypothetical protein